MSSQPHPVQTEPASAAEMAEEVIRAVVHDLRGPLLNFNGFLRRLRRGCDSIADQLTLWNLPSGQEQALRQLQRDRIDTSLQILEQNARRMDQLLESLLSLSGAGQEPLLWQSVAPYQLLEPLAEELRLRLLSRQATVEIGLLPELFSDRARLEQIFRHLLDNAATFLSPLRPGAIRIGGFIEAGEAVLWLEDNGIGIKPQDLERVFLPFGRVREIDAPGCGIGLSIVRKLGGRVWIASTHQVGATVYLAFPTRP